MLETAVDRFGRPVGGAGTFEVGQDVGGPLLERSAEGDDLGEGGGDAAADGFDEAGHQGAAGLAVGFAVGRDHALIDAPGGFDLGVLVGGE